MICSGNTFFLKFLVLYVHIIHNFKILIQHIILFSYFRHSGTFWKLVCQKEELANYECLTDKENQGRNAEGLNSLGLPKVGWAGKPMRIRPPDDYEPWRKVYLRGLQMRRNIISSNYEGWRIYANR